MFKGKGELKNFVKRQVAKALAVVMAASTLLSSSMAIAPVQAANVAPAGTQAFINEMVRIASTGTKYVWGGTTEAGGVDCRAYVKLALNNTFGTIYGYWVNEDGSLPGGTKTSVCLADWDPTVAQTLSYGPNNLGTNRICIEGNGKVAYFRVLAAGQSSGSNIRDIKYGSYTYSSLIAYACQFPGSIISHNGHCGVGLGEFHSASDLVAKYPGLSGASSGSAGGEKIRFAPAAYSMGNAYSMDNLKYWFGKTIFLSACSEKSGIRADNFTTSGKTPNPAANSTFAILQAESEIPMTEIHLYKVDAINKDKILGNATFGLYTSPTCEPNTLVKEVTLTTEYAKIELPRGKYYLREEEAPKGYQKIDRVLPVDVTSGVTKRILFENNPVNSTVIVQKVDKYDRHVVLDETKFELNEYNKDTDRYDHLVDLTYDSAIKAFTIKDSYTNNEGIRITDHSLHYSTTNNGYFQLKEVEAHPGYENSGYEETFDITDPDDQIVLTGDKAITNTAKLSLLIKKESTGGKKLAGAKFALNYGDTLYKNYETWIDDKGTDANGLTLFNDLMDSGYKAVLNEIKPPEGYEVTEEWDEGKIIQFQKGPSHLVTDPTQPDYGRFRTTITIKNEPSTVTPEEPALPEVTSGALKIVKTDRSRMDDFNVGVADAEYSLWSVEYDDATNTITEKPVTAKVDGVVKEVSNIPTDDDGEILVEDLPIGENGSVYHLREVQAPENYAIQPKTFAINLMSDMADENGVVAIETEGVSDPRQFVKLNVEKVDAKSNLGVADAVYALRNKTELTLSTDGTIVEEDTLLGYYKTDANGRFTAEKIGPEEFKLNGVTYNKANDFVLANGTNIANNGLVNGIYYFEEVVAPTGYILPTEGDNYFEVDALWRDNKTTEDVEVDGGIVKANGSAFIPATLIIQEERQTVEIELTKFDSELHTVNVWEKYGLTLEEYEIAASKGQVATLEGAEYALITVEPIVDIDTGDQIAAGTTVAIESTDSEGKLTFTEMTEGVYAGHKIPTGRYKIVEATPPSGYTLNETELTVNGTGWTGIGATIKIQDVETDDEILKQDLTIKKVSSLDKTPIANAKFSVYNASVFEAMTGSPVPISEGIVDCLDVKSKVEQYNVPAVIENVETDASGTALINDLIYGEYVIIETEVPDGYQNDPVAKCVKLPCVEDEVADETFFVYDFVAQPETPFEVVVENVPEEVSYAATITIEKVDEEGNIITSSEATFKLMDADGNEIETATTTNGVLTFNTKITEGEYGLEEVTAPIGYEGKVGVGQIVAGEVSITLTWPDETPITLKDEDGLSGNVSTTVQVINKEIKGFDVEITLNKIDSESNNIITASEATFGIYQTDGTLIEEKQTTNGVVTFDTKLQAGQYKVKELVAPTGYLAKETEGTLIIEDDVVSLSWDDYDYAHHAGDALTPGEESTDATWEGTVSKDFDVKNTLIPAAEEVLSSIIVRKYEIIDAEHKTVPGATLQILDEQGNVVVLDDGTKCEWVTAETGENVDEFGVSGHLIDKLPNGNYILHEAEAPVGYAIADDIPFTVENANREIEMIESPLKLHVKKIDAESGEKISGAKLELIQNTNGNVEFTTQQWVSDGTTKEFEYIPAGSYSIVETEAPEGYYFENNTTNVIIDQNHDGVHLATVENMRKTGQLKITKTDSKDETKLLEGVEFTLTSKNDVVDPLTNETIFTADEVVATLVTDRNGYAETVDTLPIATFDENGLKDYIVYELTETKTAPGQYVGDPSVEVIFQETEETKDDIVIVRDLAIKNYKPAISVEKHGTPATYEGPYADKKDITVVENSDIITYTISVTNDGDATGHNIVVKDAIPMNTRYTSFEDVHNAEYDEATKTMYWNIEEIAVGETIDLVFKVMVDNVHACEIANVAQYAYPDYIPTGSTEKPYLSPKGNNDWIDTNYVIHQTVEFHKSSEVPGGSKKEDAVLVNVGDTIKYTLTFKTVDEVHDIVVKDTIPAGLTYVSGSAATWSGKDTGATYNPTTRELTFTKLESGNGELTFTFDVTVDDVVIGTRVDYENVAKASYDNGLDATEELISEKITHYTLKDYKVTKTGTPKTFEGVAAEAKDVTVLQKGEEIEYTITVENTGATVLHNIVVEDVVPVGLKYVGNTTPTTAKVWVAADESKITWNVPELKAGEKIDLKFKATVAEQKAQLIVNGATYGLVENVGNTVPTLPTGSAKTNDVVHQVIEFHKTSDIMGGKDKNDAVLVEVGDTITYILEINTKKEISGTVLEDPLPEGLSFVEDSTYLKYGDDEWQKVEGVKVGDGGIGHVTVKFGKLPAGQYFFKFDTTVDKVPLNIEQFYINSAKLEYDRFTNDTAAEPEKDELLSEQVSHTTYYALKGTKDGKVETYVGPYDARKNVTVVENGEEIVYTITVENVGKAKIKNVIIKDSVPENTEFVKADNDGALDKQTGLVTWNIANLEAGKKASVTMTVKVDCDDKAVEIRNKAAFAMADKIEDIDDKEWIWTDEVIHQTVELHKTASIDHGEDEDDAKSVKIGTEFDYIITFESKNPVYGLKVSDIIPDGLTFVAGSAKYEFEDEDAVKVKDLEVGKDNTLTFPEIEEVPAGKTTFTFTVKVEDVEEYDKDYFFVNKATASVKANEKSNNTIDLESETVSNKTIKTNKTETPKLGFDTMDENTMWIIISVISAIAMIGFGWYGFIDGKKKRK